MKTVRQFAEAIATMEGFYKKGSVAARNNNPGNLRSWGSLPTRDGYAVFPTAAAGWGALERQISLNVSRGLTLEEFFAGKPGVYGGYAPASDRNDPINYARFVGRRIGIPETNAKLDALIDTAPLPPPRPHRARGRRSRPSSSPKGAKASPWPSRSPEPPSSAS